MARNQIVIEGVVGEIETRRVTPAGIPVATLKLKHDSQQGNPAQRVMLEVDAIAYGDVAKSMNDIQLGDTIAINGFLQHQRRNATMRSTTLHINISQFKLILRG